MKRRPPESPIFPYLELGAAIDRGRRQSCSAVSLLEGLFRRGWRGLACRPEGEAGQAR